MFGFPIVRQVDFNDCAFACAKMLCLHYGVGISNEISNPRRRLSPLGVSVKDFKEILQYAGFKAASARVTFAKFRRCKAPFVALLEQGHFVVVLSVTEKRVRMADPGFGLVTISTSQFMEKWGTSKGEAGDATGWIVLAEPIEQSDPEHPAGEGYSRNVPLTTQLARTLGPVLPTYSGDIWRLLVCLSVASILALAAPLLTQVVVDAAVPSENIHLLVALLLAQLLMTIGRVLSGAMRAWISVHMGSLIGLDLRDRFMSKLVELPLEFFQHRPPGFNLNRLRDHGVLEAYASTDLTNMLVGFTTILAYGALIAYYDVSVLLVFLVSVFLGMMWHIAFLKRLKVIDYAQFNSSSQNDNVLLQLFSGMVDIKMADQTERQLDSWRDVQRQIVQQRFKKTSLNQIQKLGTESIGEIRNIAIVFLAAVSVMNGQLSLGMMLAITFMVGQLDTPIKELLRFVYQTFVAGLVSDRAMHVFEQESEQDGTEPYPERTLVKRSGLELDCVRYHYPGADTAAVEDIDVNIAEGTLVALIGHSGAGKTTLLKLIGRLYLPTSGHIRVGGQDLSSIQASEYRRNVAAVFNDSHVFSDSVRDNVTLWDADFDRARLKSVLDATACTEFVSELPMGEKTRIGDGGVGLSAGQRQRILLARALYRDPQILLLDEPTSSLDSKNERLFLETLNRVKSGRTVIMAAHRLSTVETADLAIVLERGRVSKVGSVRDVVESQHAESLATTGVQS